MKTTSARRTRQFVLGLLCSAALVLGLGAALGPTASAAPVSGGQGVVLTGDASYDATYAPTLQRVSGMVTPPEIRGTAKVGAKLTTTPGEWSVEDLDFAYQWLIDGQPVDDAVKRSFSVPRTALGGEVSVEVTVWGLPKRVTVAADPVGPVQRGVLPVQARPQLKGTPRVGRWLTVSRAVTSPKARVSIRWFVDGKRVKGATGQRLKVTKSMRGSRVSVEVTLRATGYVPRTYGARTTRIR